jgi:Mg2+ and Co2+ transporter CorA
MELRLLERVVKSQTDTIKQISSEVRDYFERLAKMHIKLEKRNQRVLEKNKKLYNMVRCLKTKLILKYAKLITHPGLEDLAEGAENLNEKPSSLKLQKNYSF